MAGGKGGHLIKKYDIPFENKAIGVKKKKTLSHFSIFDKKQLILPLIFHPSLIKCKSVYVLLKIKESVTTNYLSNIPRIERNILLPTDHFT